MAVVLLKIIIYLGLSAKCVLSRGESSTQYIGPSIISEGDVFAISCVTSFHGTSSWIFNGSIAITDENLLGYEVMERKLDSVYKEMIVRSVSAQLFHTGEYRCNGNSREFHILRVVEDADTVTEAVTDSPANKSKRDDGDRYPKRYSLQPNATYEFSCAAEDEKDPVLWYKNKNQINAFTSPNLELYDQQLIIYHAQLEDVGEYTCRLDAPFPPGKSDVISRYLLTSPAQIIDISEKQSVVRGRQMTVYCKAEGYPSPRITWYIGNLNAFMLKEKDLRMTVYSRQDRFPNAYLTVRNLTRFDSGLYTCRAENGIGKERHRKFHEKSISVYVRDNIIEPNEDKPGLGKILVPGEPLILQCKAEECISCSMVWFKGDQKLSSEENYMHVDDENNTLTIHSATVNDTGIYECAVDRALLNVDLRATIKVQTCEELLGAGFQIESICEMPVIAELSVSGAMSSFHSLRGLWSITFITYLWWKMTMS